MIDLLIYKEKLLEELEILLETQSHDSEEVKQVLAELTCVREQLKKECN